MEILSKICERSAEDSYLIVNFGEKVDNGALCLAFNQTVIMLKHITYFQSCVVYNLEWNTRILLFASVFLHDILKNRVPLEFVYGNHKRVCLLRHSDEIQNPHVPSMLYLHRLIE